MSVTGAGMAFPPFLTQPDPFYDSRIIKAGDNTPLL